MLPAKLSALVPVVILLLLGAIGACVAWLVWRAYSARFGPCLIRQKPIAWLGFWIACLIWLLSTSVWAFQAAEASVFDRIGLIGQTLQLLHRHPILSIIVATTLTVSGCLILLRRVKAGTTELEAHGTTDVLSSGPDEEEARDGQD